ncbi:MAG: hypothetical protein ABSC64_22165, partial [Candidatus Korobacteraceae bacterium]
FKAESSSDSLVFPNSTYQRLSAFFFPAALSTAELIWTRMISYLSFRPTELGQPFWSFLLLVVAVQELKCLIPR